MQNHLLIINSIWLFQHFKKKKKRKIEPKILGISKKIKCCERHRQYYWLITLIKLVWSMFIEKNVNAFNCTASRIVYRWEFLETISVYCNYEYLHLRCLYRLMAFSSYKRFMKKKYFVFSVIESYFFHFTFLKIEIQKTYFYQKKIVSFIKGYTKKFYFNT